MLPSVSLDLSGERFKVIYRLLGDEAEARATAEDTCLEQTVEFPGELVPDGDIRDSILGRIESLSPVDSNHYEAEINYAVETTGFELIQLLNVIFGNTSLKPGIRVERLEFLYVADTRFPSPRHEFRTPTEDRKNFGKVPQNKFPSTAGPLWTACSMIIRGNQRWKFHSQHPICILQIDIQSRFKIITCRFELALTIECFAKH